jgi:hypothetical protein
MHHSSFVGNIRPRRFFKTERLFSLVAVEVGGVLGVDDAQISGQA